MYKAICYSKYSEILNIEGCPKCIHCVKVFLNSICRRKLRDTKKRGFFLMRKIIKGTIKYCWEHLTLGVPCSKFRNLFIRKLEKKQAYFAKLIGSRCNIPTFCKIFIHQYIVESFLLQYTNRQLAKKKIYKHQQQQLICIADLQPCTVKLSGPKVMVTITAWWRTTPFTSTMRSRTSTSTSEPTSVWISLWWTVRPTSQLATNRSVVQTTEHTPISN